MGEIARQDQVDLVETSDRAELPAVFRARSYEDLVAAFYRKYNANTSRAYQKDLRTFAEFVGTGDDVMRATEYLFRAGHGRANGAAAEYSNWLIAKGLAPATVRRRLAALQALVALGRTLGLCNWALEVESPKPQAYRDTRGPGREGWERMEALARLEASTGDPLKVRNLAMMAVAYARGLRRSSLVNLDIEHLELGGREANLWVQLKGKADRIRVALPEDATADLKAWLAVRGSHPGPLFHALDRGRIGRGALARLTGQAVWDIVRDLGRRAGLERPVRPHGIRHASISELLELNNGNIVEAQAFAGHADPRTTMIYLDALTNAGDEGARRLARARAESRERKLVKSGVIKS